MASAPETNSDMSGFTLPAEIAELRRLVAAGDMDLARATAKACEDFVPASEAAWSEYQHLLKKLGLRIQEEIMTVKFLEQFPGSGMARISLASVMVAGERWREARAQIDLLFAHPVQTLAFWNGMSRIVWGMRNWEQLAAAGQAGLRLSPTSFQMHFVHAVALWFLKRGRASLKAFNQALDNAGGKMAPFVKVIRFADEHGVPDIGETAFAGSLALLAANPSAANWMQLLALLQEKFEPARIDRFFGVAETVAIQNPEVLTSLFDFAWSNASPAAALAVGRRLQSMQPDRADLAPRLHELETRLAQPSLPSDRWWNALRARPAVRE